MKSIFLFFSLLIASVSFAHTEHTLDSIGVKEVNGQYFILHKVEKGEGLYAISRRYNVPVDAIEKANPDAKSGLKLGEILLIPTTIKKEAAKEEVILHTVKPGETLYAISKQYNVSVDQIKIKNKLTSNNLTVGQELVIKGTKPKEVTEHVENYGGEEKPPVTKPKEETPVVKEQPGKYEYNSATGEVKESGFAVVAVNEIMNQERSFCLHPTAPVGTIIMVTNAQTNKSVFVRVVGKPESMEPQVILKLSKAAGDRLGIGENDRVSVRLNYAK